MQCVPLSEHPTPLNASIRICRAYTVGVMVDLEAHGLPAATILAEGGVNWDHLSDSGTLQLFIKCHCIGLMRKATYVDGLCYGCQ